ncbi:hypothetical protein 7865G3B6_24 [Haloquadratum phage sp.]|jgi:hypothetical protein|nr:hypothetical protein 7865G3B6_24 [Haloquadratum phage sp.]
MPRATSIKVPSTMNDHCKKENCNKDGFIIVNTDDEMLCIDHFNQAYENAYDVPGPTDMESEQ